MAAEDDRFEEWWKQKKDWICYPIAQKVAAKSAWIYLEKKLSEFNKQIASALEVSVEMHDFAVKHANSEPIHASAHIERWSRQLSNNKGV